MSQPLQRHQRHQQWISLVVQQSVQLSAASKTEESSWRHNENENTAMFGCDFQRSFSAIPTVV